MKFKTKLILAVIAIILLCGGSYYTYQYFYNIKPDYIASFNEEGLNFNQIEENDNYANKLYYSQLSLNEQKYYQCMYHSSINGSNHFEYTYKFNENDIEKAMRAFKSDWPEYYWWNDLTTNTISIANSLGKVFYYIKTSANISETDIINDSKKINNIYEQIKNYLVGSNDYTTIKKIYEYVINNVEYDLNYIDSQDLRSAFIDGKGVCAGYATVFQYLANHLGYECYPVFGYAANDSESTHEWNIIKIKNNWYLVDPTWGEEHDDNFKQTSIKYDTFLATNEIFEIDHVAKTEYIYPVCNDDSYYFYDMPGAFLREFNESTITNLFNEWRNKYENKYSLKFKNKTDLNSFVDWLNNNGFFKYYSNNISNIYNLELNWSINEDSNLIIIDWKDRLH